MEQPQAMRLTLSRFLRQYYPVQVQGADLSPNRHSLGYSFSKILITQVQSSGLNRKIVSL